MELDPLRCAFAMILPSRIAHDDSPKLREHVAVSLNHRSLLRSGKMKLVQTSSASVNGQ